MDDSEFLRAFVESNDPVLFTGEIAKYVGMSNQGALPRLKDLKSRGLVESKKGGRVPAWWITESGREYLETSDIED